jgi:biopolymer transport protein ExbD
MQLSRGGSEVSLQSEINITPLVDVVLVLLIIFMVVVPLLMQGYDVNIPRASANIKPTQAVDSQLILSIAPTECPMIGPPAGDGLPANCSLSGRAAEDHVLFLAADDTLNYEGVLRIIDLAKSNIEDLRIEFVATK